MNSSQVLRRRKARIAFGWGLTAVVPLWLAVLALAFFQEPGPNSVFKLGPVFVLGAVWLVSATFLLLHFRAGRQLESRSSAASAAAALHFDTDAALARAAARRSFVMPAVGLALITPLSLHALIALLMGELQDMGIWIFASLVLVSHAHAAFAVSLGFWAAKLARDPYERIAGAGTAVAAGTAMMMACIPGIVLLAIPPAITLVTGLILAPLILCWLQRAAKLEDQALQN